MKTEYFVYILASRSKVLYVGTTNNLIRRVQQHRDGEGSKFTSKYNVHRLVYYESHQYVLNANRRETQLKSWRREKKIQLIESFNPDWEDKYPLICSVPPILGW